MYGIEPAGPSGYGIWIQRDEYRRDGRYDSTSGRGSRLSKDYFLDYYWYFGETIQIYLISAHWSHDSTTGIFDAHLNYTHENDIMTARLFEY